MMNTGFLIIAGSLVALLLILLVLVAVRTFKNRQHLKRTRDRSEATDNENTTFSEQQQEAPLAVSFAPSAHQQAPISPAPRSPLGYERFPRLSASIQQAKARRELVTTLAFPLTMVLNGCLARAIDLSCEQSGVSRTEGAQTVAGLLDNAGERPSAHLSFPNGADPLVTLLLLHADCREDALRYFCLSSGASPAEARDAIDTLRPLAESTSWFFFEEGMPGEPSLDPASLHFLVRAGYTTLAIRYYRRRTASGFAEAKKAVTEIAHQLA